MCQQSFNDLKHMCTTAPIHAYADFSKPFKLHTDTCRCGLGAVLYQTHDDRTGAIIAYIIRSLTKAEAHYPAHKLKFLSLKWVAIEKFHEYLYGSTFDIYTNNNPLMYMLTMAKLDAMSHQWVPSLANYNFQLYYRAGKTNIDGDALSRVSWPRCVSNTLGEHHWVTVAAVWALQEDTLKGPASPLEAYSCDLHILDLVGDGLQVTFMTTDDWHQAQQADPVLDLVILRMQDGTLGHAHWNRMTHLRSSSSFKNSTTSSLGGASCIGKSYQKNYRKPNFKWSWQQHIGRLLWEGVMMRLAT